MRARPISTWLAAAAGALMLSAPTVAEPTDTAVKAAFLPRFARYVTWPAAAMPRGSDPFVLCVIGGDPFGAALDDAARSQAVDGRRIAIRRMDSAAGTDACQIAFIQGGKAQRRSVHTGMSNFDYVELRDNVKPGDRIITSDMSAFKYSDDLTITD